METYPSLTMSITRDNEAIMGRHVRDELETLESYNVAANVRSSSVIKILLLDYYMEHKENFFITANTNPKAELITAVYQLEKLNLRFVPELFDIYLISQSQDLQHSSRYLRALGQTASLTSPIEGARGVTTARRCLGLLIPKLDDVEGESWEELDTMEIAHGAPSLHWLPKIDKDSLESLSAECTRIVVNPKPSPFSYRGVEVPRGAPAVMSLDDPIVKEVDPKTWAVFGFAVRATSGLSPAELPVAENFRLALERDTRLAPKRAKNARQHQWRAERETVTLSTSAKALALALQASKSLQTRNW